MKYEVSERWTTTDDDIYFVHNYTDFREEIYFSVNGDQEESKIDAGTFVSGSSTMENGDHLIINTTDAHEIHWVVNGKPENQMI